MRESALRIMALALLLLIGCGGGGGGGGGAAPSGGSPQPPAPADPDPDPVILINEFLASNGEGLEDEDGDSSDWIELYNPEDSTVDLSGWVLSNGSTGEWIFPAVSIASGEFLVVFASGKDRKPSPVTVVDGISNLHTNFQLARSGEYLALADADGNFQPESRFSPGFPKQERDTSYGRYEGGTEFRHFLAPTPGQINSGDVYGGRVANAAFSIQRGFYDSAFALALTSSTGGATIRYTLDGSEPTAEHGSVYSTPLEIEATSTVRAFSYRSNWLPATVDTHTYIFIGDVVNQSPSGEAPGPDWPVGSVNG